MARAGPQLELGRVVDGVYEILGRVGVGGMASVYRVLQREKQEQAALKLIDLGVEDVGNVRRRFFNELLLATRVRHPNIVDVHDFGLLASLGAPYIVMELLEGRNLRQQLRRYGPLTLEEAMPLFLGALSALKVAHELDVVHKDLKPSNLFLADADTSDRSLVILDFGIAVRVSAGAEATGDYRGTPRYAAPEYVLKQIVTPALDVYQMALVFCEAVSGEPVVRAKGSEDCFEAHIRGELEIPGEALGLKLETVMRKALAHDHTARYPNAGALLAALTAAHGEANPTLRQSAPPTPPRREATGTGEASYGGPAPGSAAARADDDDAPTRMFDWHAPATGTDDGAEQNPTVVGPSDVDVEALLAGAFAAEPDTEPVDPAALPTSFAPEPDTEPTDQAEEEAPGVRPVAGPPSGPGDRGRRPPTPARSWMLPAAVGAGVGLACFAAGAVVMWIMAGG